MAFQVALARQFYVHARRLVSLLVVLGLLIVQIQLARFLRHACEEKSTLTAEQNLVFVKFAVNYFVNVAGLKDKGAQ